MAHASSTSKWNRFKKPRAVTGSSRASYGARESGGRDAESQDAMFGKAEPRTHGLDGEILSSAPSSSSVTT
jgi:hypothetical protein